MELNDKFENSSKIKNQGPRLFRQGSKKLAVIFPLGG